MAGLAKGATFAIGTVVVVLAVGVLAYRAWQTVGSNATGVATAVHVPVPASRPAVTLRASPKVDRSMVAARPARRPALPGFDIVRVEPSGDTVVAGRAEPNAQVSLLDKGKVIAKAKTDANGQFAVIPPALPAGHHLLALSQKIGGRRVISAQTVTVAVPKSKSPGHVLAALTAPDQPTRLLSPPASGVPGTQKPGERPTIAIRTVEAEQDGGFFVSGSAAPEAAVRLYLDGSPIADLRAGSSGGWSLHRPKGPGPGSYIVRADQIDPATGRVLARAEVAFDDKALAAAKAGPGRTAENTGSTNEALEAISKVTVVRGDSLWRISRKVLGRGIRYTEIYAANASQIRNPRLIYPGQVLVTPHTSVN